MTIEELKNAFDEINRAIKYSVEELHDPYPNVWKTTLYTCREALQKQIPKKPLQDCLCPNCGKCSVMDGEYGEPYNFCPECGKAIDWRDEE